MLSRCVDAGCSQGASDKVSLHEFPKDGVLKILKNGPDKWREPETSLIVFWNLAQDVSGKQKEPRKPVASKLARKRVSILLALHGVRTCLALAAWSNECWDFTCLSMLMWFNGVCSVHLYYIGNTFVVATIHVYMTILRINISGVTKYSTGWVLTKKVFLFHRGAQKPVTYDFLTSVMDFYVFVLLLTVIENLCWLYTGNSRQKENVQEVGECVRESATGDFGIDQQGTFHNVHSAAAGVFVYLSSKTV